MDALEHEAWWAQRGARDLRELLFHKWDPIGMLEGFRPDMGLEPSHEPPLGVARSIRDWYARSTAAWAPGGGSEPAA